MTTKVTKESLAENIGRLESYGDLSLNEEYQLNAYRLLIDMLQEDCIHDYAIFTGEGGYAVRCRKCGVKHAGWYSD